MSTKHIKQQCDDDCCDPNCNTCNLFTCAVCGCAEAQLPSDCPGVYVESNRRDDIMHGKLDYKDGTWWDRYA